MQTPNKLSFIILLFAIIITISSCGKISQPSVIEGSGYPHSYPQK